MIFWKQGVFLFLRDAPKSVTQPTDLPNAVSLCQNTYRLPCNLWTTHVLDANDVRILRVLIFQICLTVDMLPAVALVCTRRSERSQPRYYAVARGRPKSVLIKKNYGFQFLGSFLNTTRFPYYKFLSSNRRPSEKSLLSSGAVEVCYFTRKAQATAVLLFVEQTCVAVILYNVHWRHPVRIPVALYVAQRPSQRVSVTDELV
jgi:hypothetical protein